MMYRCAGTCNNRVFTYSRDYKAVLFDGLNWASAPATLDADAKVQFIE